MRCWCCLLHEFAVLLLIADELVRVVVLVLLHGWADEAVRLAAFLLRQHAGCNLLLRCVQKCCMMRMLLYAAAGAAALAASLECCWLGVARRVSRRMGAGGTRGCRARGREASAAKRRVCRIFHLVVFFVVEFDSS